MYFSWPTDRKKGFKSLSVLTFPLKIGPHAPHTLLEIVGVQVFLCIFMCVHMSMLHKLKKNTVIRMPRSLPFISLEKSSKKNLFAKGHTRQSNTLQFHFHFVHSSFSPASLPPSLPSHYLPTPSVFLQSISHQTNRACLAFQSSHSEQLSACHILSEFSPSFGREETELQWNHGPADSQPLNNNNNKKVWQVLPTCFHRFNYFGSILVAGGVHKFVTGPQSISGSHRERKFECGRVWKQKTETSSDGSPHSVSSAVNASCRCLFYKSTADNTDGDHKTPPGFIFHVTHFAGDCQMFWLC